MEDGLSLPTIDLTNYGYPLSIVGRVRREQRDGGRFLFLFSETHTDYAIIRQNLLNACALAEAGVVFCAGVEGRYSFADYDRAEAREIIDSESRRLFSEFGDVRGVIDFFIRDAQEMDRQEPGVPHLFFGDCLQLLRPSLAVRCVEDESLADEAAAIQHDMVTELARELGLSLQETSRLLREGVSSEPIERMRLAFRGHEINRRRDERFVTNMLAFWSEVAPDSPAILNAGTAHLDRLGEGSLLAGFRFIQVIQEGLRPV